MSPPNHLLALALFAVWINCEGSLVGQENQGQPTQFDVTRVIECRDVTTPEFFRVYPQEKLIDLRVLVSAFFNDRPGSELAELQYRFYLPDRAYQILDFEPHTTLATGYSGTISVEANDTEKKSLGLQLSGNSGLWGKADGQAAFDQSHMAKRSAELVPPRDLMSAAGTIAGGSGLLFKFKPTPWTTLEGAREFAAIVRVPRTWQGDFAVVHCQSICHRRDLPFQGEQRRPCANSIFVVGLFMEGNQATRSLAIQLARREQQLRKTAGSYEMAFAKHGRNSGSPLDLLANLFESGSSHSTVARWLEDLLSAAPQQNQSRKTSVPSVLRRHAESYLMTRDRLHQANGLPGRDA